MLVAQSRRQVDHFARDGDRWTFEILEGEDDVLVLTAIGVTLSLRAIYEGVELPGCS